jgi:hypothetical protein
MKAIAPGAFDAAPLASAASDAPSTRRRSAPPKPPTSTRSVWSATSIMDAAGGPGDHAMFCAISTTPATSPAEATTTTAGAGYYDRGYGYGGPWFIIRGW